ncbi:hypothetical protein RHSIM_Rhsim01G0263100 [Rhododendron simsii]|uniref:Cupin type-1 domain-containing protein n=1 Tax=Rhododendron simsii TaxID=118357 RepID=A0A834HFM0_RHOSS|nr:hypothetical protein RHSIM_Rhsim01G0263100 [Rhododendron simsii]
MAKLSMLSVFLCFLVLFHCSVAYGQQGGRRSPFGEQGQRGQRRQGDCQLNNLNAQEPQHRLQAEAGVTEFWDFDDDQFRGIQGVMMSGCPETYQSSQQQSEGGGRREGGGQRFRDQHQKIRRFREGDVIALPAGVAHWCYNDGDSELVAVIMEDTGNHQNQLDNNPRKFFLAGNPQQQGQGQQQQQQRERFRHREQRQERNFGNVFSGFDTEVLAEAFGVDRETARKLQGQDDNRGHIIRVEGDLQVLRPSRSREEQEEEERGREYGRRANGLEETICSARLVENINDPSRADFFNPRAGRLTTLNNFNLPILNFLRLSAEKGVLYRDAFMPPHYRLNAHCLLYATRGEAQMQIVDNRGQSVFNDRIREGQMVVVPQNFVVSKQAGNEGFEWVAMKTNENAMFSTLAGRTSALRAMPVDVVANAYQISRDEARRLKMNREETILMEPRRAGRIRSVA